VRYGCRYYALQSERFVMPRSADSLTDQSVVPPSDADARVEGLDSA
jgi:hypothetical protein